MPSLTDLLLDGLDASARGYWTEARARVERDGPAALPLVLPALGRRFGRHPLTGQRLCDADVDVDLSVWRACDAAGRALLEIARPGAETLVDLYLRGDLEERTILLRSLALAPVTEATVRLLGEVQRTNTVVHVEAGALDSNLVVRTLDAGTGFTQEDFHRLVLKIAFLDLPIWRMFGALERANRPLSDMLQAYATEREAAGRTVWVDTYRFVGRAPTDGSVARLLGGLEHGADPVRLAAAEGLAALARPDLAPYVRERLEREPRDRIRRILHQTL